MQEKLNRLIEKHCASIKHTVSQVGGLLAQIRDGAASAPLDSVCEAEALAHQLKGSTGTVGFREVCEAATALDDHLKILCRADSEAVINGIGDTMLLFDRLSAIVSTITPSASTLYKAA
jgi:HPt (histidine-containing phosphotransfer) domain-containing protein